MHSVGERHRIAGKRLSRIAFAIVAAAGMIGGSMVKQVVPEAGAVTDDICYFGNRAIRDIDHITYYSGNGKVDFGSDPHAFGAPRLPAVVCWDEGRHRADVGGNVFWDSGDKGCGSVRFDWYNTSGQNVYSNTDRVCSPNGGFRSAVATSLSLEANLDRLRVRLYKEGTLVGTINRYYGD
jgi:hypothetical protein